MRGTCSLEVSIVRHIFVRHSWRAKRFFVRSVFECAEHFCMFSFFVRASLCQLTRDIDARRRPSVRVRHRHRARDRVPPRWADETLDVLNEVVLMRTMVAYLVRFCCKKVINMFLKRECQ